MDNNGLKIGSLLSYLQMAASTIMGMLYTPVMIRLLGMSEYGLYNTVSSTIAMLSVLNLGFNSSYIKYYSRYKERDDQESIKKLNGLFLIIFIIIGLIVLLCGLFLTFNLHAVFDMGLTSDEYTTAKTLMLLFTFNLAVSFPMSVFHNIISAREKFIFLKVLGMLKTILGPLITLPLLLAGRGSIAAVSITVIINLVADICYFAYSRIKLNTRFDLREHIPGLSKELFVFAIFIAINTVVNIINSNMDKFLLGRYMGTGAVAVYSVGYALYHYYVMFSTAVSGVFTPRIHHIHNLYIEDKQKHDDEMTALFIKVGRIQYIILALIATGAVFFGERFIFYWAGAGYTESYYVALFLIIPGTIPLIQNLGIEIQRAENKHRFRSIAYLIMAFVNLALSIYLIKWYGVVGAVMGTAVSLIIANGFLMNVYYATGCRLKISEFWLNVIKTSKGLIIPALVGMFIKKHITIKSLTMLFLFVLAYTVVYCVSVWFLGMNDFERDIVRKPLNKLLRRRH